MDAKGVINVESTTRSRKFWKIERSKNLEHGGKNQPN
jgi:hypothetical protein